MSDEKLEAKLVYHGSLKGKYHEEYLITGDLTTIGRSGDIIIPKSTIYYTGEGHDEVGVSKAIRTSRQHAKIVMSDGQYVLEDLGSKIGTYVNGTKLGQPQLEPWKVRFCHSENYYGQREPQIRENNKGSIILNDGDIITLGKEMYNDKHEFVFRVESID